MKRAFALLAGASCVGCAWEPGHGFATLSGTTIAASLVLDEPLLSDSGGEVTLSSLELDVAAIELQGLSAAPAGPEHEHEHDEEEALEAEAPLQAVATVHVDQTLDWLAGTPVAVASVEPSRELPEAELLRVAVSLTALRLRGDVGGTELVIELPLALTLTGSLGFEVNRDAPERLSLSVTIEQSARLFAGLDSTSLEENLAQSDVRASIDEVR